MFRYFITWENEEGKIQGEIVEGSIHKINNFLLGKINPKIKKVKNV